MKSPTNKIVKEDSQISLLDIVGIIAGILGATTALFWFLGRIDYMYYYNARGASELVNIVSANEYIATGAINSIEYIVYIVLLIMFSFLEVGIVIELPAFIKRIASKVFPKKKESKKILSLYIFLLVGLITSIILLFRSISADNYIFTYPITYWIAISLIIILIIDIYVLFFSALTDTDISLVPFFRKSINTMKVFVYGIFMLILIVYSVIGAQKSGYLRGCLAKYNRSTVYTIYSEQSLPLEGSRLNSNTGKIYQYPSYFLLLGEQYFLLYKNVDPNTGELVDSVLIQSSKILGVKKQNIIIPDSELKSNKIICDRLTDQMMQKYFKSVAP